MQILYMGDGEWGRLSLKKLLNSNQEVIGIIIRTNPSDNKLQKLAKKNNIPIFQPEDINSEIIFSKVKELNPELIVSMSYDQILEKKLINFPENGIINVHAGMLPYYRGRSPINWAIINGEDCLGLTVHYIDENIDTGDIILQEKIEINSGDNYRTILEKAEKIAPKVLMKAIVLIENDLVIRKQQKSNGIYLPKRKGGDEIINWKWSSERIHNFIRALVPPGPCARTYINDNEIKILESKLIDAPNFIGNPGQVVGRDDDGVSVKTGDSIIKITKIKINDKKIVPNFNIRQKLGINYKEKINDLTNKISKLKKQIKRLKGD